MRALARIGVVLEDAHGPGPWQDQLTSAALFDIDSGERLLTAPRRTGSVILVARPTLMAALEAAVPTSVRHIHEAVETPWLALRGITAQPPPAAPCRLRRGVLGRRASGWHHPHPQRHLLVHHPRERPRPRAARRRADPG